MRFVIGLIILWRLLLFLFSFIGGLYFSFAPRFPYSEIFLGNSGLPDWFWKFGNFDGVHYLTIAQNGYSAQYTQVFFPLYPMILGLISSIISLVNPVMIGILMSSVFFLSAIFVFVRLLKFDYEQNEIRWIILFLVFFPTSFFFGSIYTESLFLFFVFSSFYYARREKWLVASIFGALSCATRLVGIFLIPALLWEWHNSNIKYQISNIKPRKNHQKLSSLLSSIYHLLASPIIYIVPLGLVSYMIYLQIKFGDALLFWHVQPVFGAQRSGSAIVFLPQVFWRYIKIFTTNPANSQAFWIPILEFISTVFGIIILVFAHLKKIRLSYLIFCWPVLFLPTLTGTLSSMPRYILPLFPIYIVLGTVKSKKIKISLLVALFFLLCILTAFFTSGIWVA